MKTERLKACVNVYLVLQQKDKTLLSLRQNTGYEDGQYSLVSGHLEHGETPSDALIRESFEEVGVIIREKDLTMAHVMYRTTDRENIDLFFLCRLWGGDIQNLEPQKCGGLSFFASSQMPSNTIGYIKCALENIESGIIYSEFGVKDAC